MKAFVIHTSDPESRRYASTAMASLRLHDGWEPEFWPGVEPATLETYPEAATPVMKKSRAADFRRTSWGTFIRKKCCSLNHLLLARWCLQLDEPIAVVEHDSLCTRGWVDIDFEDVLILNLPAAADQECYTQRVTNSILKSATPGVHRWACERLRCRHSYNTGYMMPGTAAYAITPRGASRLVRVYETMGWEQSDFIINTNHVAIESVVPGFFKFRYPNLRMSHG